MKRIENTGGNLYLFLVRGRSVPGGRGPRQPTEGRQHHHRKQVPDTLLASIIVSQSVSQSFLYLFIQSGECVYPTAAALPGEGPPGPRRRVRRPGVLHHPRRAVQVPPRQK